MAVVEVQYVIIGNGGAGVRALQAIREVDNESDVTIISHERYPAYSPCSLPSLLSGEIEKPTIFRFEKKFYHHLNATFMKNTTALQIIPKRRKVQLSNGKSIIFDKLLIAAGAKSITPKGIKGLNLDGVHIMGTLDSTLDILAQLKRGVNRVVVIGGGFMGVEAAAMLKKRDINVSIVETFPQILLRMLDPDISEKVEEILLKHDINLICNDTVNSINGKRTVKSVSLRRKKLYCDMVIIAVGVKPNIDLLKGSNITVNQGIIVDSTMQTNIKNIYAAGDIAEVREQIIGKQGSFAIWPNAVEQGRIAGLNMAGKCTVYNGAEVINVLDIFDTPVVAMGHTSKEIGKCNVISRVTPHTSKKILVKNNRIVGLQFVGTIKNTGTFYSLMKKGSDVSNVRERLLDDNFISAPAQK